MSKRVALVCAVVTLLSGCVTGSGVDYVGLSQKLGPPTAGQSRVVVLAEKSSGPGFYCGCNMKLDGQDIGKVIPGTFVYADRPAGNHALTATEVLYAGESKLEIRTDSGRVSFFLIRSSKRHDAVVATTYVAGLAGAANATVASSGAENPGPVDIFPLDDTAARTTLAELQLAQ